MTINPYIRREVYLVKEEKKGKVNYRILKGRQAIDKWLILVQQKKIKGHIVSVDEETTQVCTTMDWLSYTE